MLMMVVMMMIMMTDNERKMIVSVLGIHRPFPHRYSFNSTVEQPFMCR